MGADGVALCGIRVDQGTLMAEKLTIRLWEIAQAHTALTDAWRHVKQWLLAGNRLILEIRPEKRSDRQNKLLHALFGDVSRQAEWLGKRRTPGEWKVLFISGHSVATKSGAEMVPGIEGEFVNIRESSAGMSIPRMTSLIEYVIAYAVSNGVELRDARQWMDVDPETGELLERAA